MSEVSLYPRLLNEACRLAGTLCCSGGVGRVVQAAPESFPFATPESFGCQKFRSQRGRDVPPSSSTFFGQPGVRLPPAVSTKRELSPQGPLGPLGFNFSQHGPTTRPSRRKDCRESIYAFGSHLASSAEARVEEIVGGSVGVGVRLLPQNCASTVLGRPGATGEVGPPGQLGRSASQSTLISGFYGFM